MIRIGRATVAVLLASLLPASIVCAEPIVLRGATMGTTYHIKLVEAPDSVKPQALQVEVDQVLAEIDRQMSTYRPDSELSQFNRSAPGDWFPVSEATAVVAAAAQDISSKTDGALDITVGPLVRLWHFGPATDAKRDGSSLFTPPTESAIAAARKKVGYEKLDVRAKPPALRKSVEGLEVDLSSIASGYAIDQLANLIAKQGVNNFMAEIGGEVRAAGHRHDGGVWRVAVERPSIGPRELFVSLPLSNAAIATAGDYRKFIEYEGRRYSHVIDPATGRPIEHQLTSVTVVANTCMAADGWDTPLLVLGPDRGLQCAKKYGIAALFLSNDAGETKAQSTPGWRQRFGKPKRNSQ